MRVFGIDPGSERTGYGCVETDGRRHSLVLCGAVTTNGSGAFADRLAAIHRELRDQLRECRPSVVAVENLFHAVNVRSALKLGHARGVAMLAAVEAGVDIVEYTPAEIKRAVVGYGRAEKAQVQQMMKLLLRLDAVPTPHDAADALAVAMCHVHRMPALTAAAVVSRRSAPAIGTRSWRTYSPPAEDAVRRARAGARRP